MMDVKFRDAADQISIAWMAGRLRQRARSRDGTEEKLGYLKGSLQVLVDRLVGALREEGVEVRCNAPVKQFATSDGHVTGVQTPDQALEADAVLSTTPTPILAGLVEDINGEYADSLREIEYMGAICTILSMEESLSPVYWLNVADPGYSFGGVIEQTHLIPLEKYGGRHLAYLSRYVRHDHPLWSKGDEKLLSQQLGELQRLFGRDVKPIVNDHWIFRGRFAAPITGLKFSEKIPSYDTPIPGLYMAAMPHVYPDERSTNNSIRIAVAAVKGMGLDSSLVPEGNSLAAKFG
jgi:protoporphyrinogen oxidase